jgi:hypothetical protein
MSTTALVVSGTTFIGKPIDDIKMRTINIVFATIEHFGQTEPRTAENGYKYFLSELILKTKDYLNSLTSILHTTVHNK